MDIKKRKEKASKNVSKNISTILSSNILKRKLTIDEKEAVRKEIKKREHNGIPESADTIKKSQANKEGRSEMCEDDLRVVREEIKQKQKAAMETPKIFLKLDEEGVATRNGKPHIYIKDLQLLLLYTLHKHAASTKAKWCHFLRPNKLHSTFLLIIDTLTADDFHQHQQQFKFLNTSFPMRVHVISPGEYNMSLEQELFSVSVSNRQLIHTDKSTETDTNIVKDEKEDYSRLDLMLDSFEMMNESYPMPYREFVFSKFHYSCHNYQLPTQNSAMFGVDCEMVETTLSSHELAWVCVVDEDLKCVYESLVMPKGVVTNYLTKYSGISKETLHGVTTKVRDVQKALRTILPHDAILVGQSLNYDLKALRIYHPFVIDTSCIFNLSGFRFKKPKLQLLSSLFLRREIQRGEGHDPREDAEAAMQLVLLKLKKGINFGNVMQGWKVEEVEKDDFMVVEEEVEKDVSDARFKGVNGYKDVSEDVTKERDKSELKSMFFRSNKYCMNLFKHFVEENKNVSLVNFPPAFLSTLKDNCDTERLKVISIEDDDESDKAAMRKCREEIVAEKNFMNILKLTQSSTYLSSDCKNCFKRSVADTDLLIKKLHKSLPDRSLMIVLLTGRGGGENAKDGLCFVKIKIDQ